MSAGPLERLTIGGWPQAGERWGVALRRERATTDVPTLYVHGVPTASWDWEPFLARTGGIAPDLPGFGASDKRGDGDFTLRGLGRFPGPLLDALGVERVALVVHDWGAAALQWAAAHPQRVARLVVLDAVPLLGGYRWHRLARLWRTRGLGELLMGATTRTTLRLLSRQANAAPGPLPQPMLDRVLAGLDQGTQRAILRLYRSADEAELARAGAPLGELSGVPSLVAWGAQDPYLPAGLAAAYAEAVGGAEVEVLDGAGHWPWLDRPQVVERVTSFLGAR